MKIVNLSQKRIYLFPCLAVKRSFYLKSLRDFLWIEYYLSFKILNFKLIQFYYLFKILLNIFFNVSFCTISYKVLFLQYIEY